MNNERDLDFYKDFYDKNRIPLLQYESLRYNFNKMVDDVLGEDYYNFGMDVYSCDRICCEDITYKANHRSWFSKLFDSKRIKRIKQLESQNKQLVEVATRALNDIREMGEKL